MSNKMSPKQFNAYMKLEYDTWKSAYVLKSTVRQSTLDALVKKGYAEKKHFYLFGVSYRRTDKAI